MKQCDKRPQIKTFFEVLITILRLCHIKRRMIMENIRSVLLMHYGQARWILFINVEAR